MLRITAVLFISAAVATETYAGASQESTDIFVADTTIAALVYHKTLLLLESGNVAEASKELCAWLDMALDSLGQTIPNATQEQKDAAFKVLKSIQKNKGACKLSNKAQETLNKYAQ